MWDKIKDLVGSAAPLLGTALGGAPGGAVGSIIASALGTDNDADAIEKALKTDPEAYAKLKQAEQEHQRELRSMILQAETARISEVNATYRREIGSEDAYVRRARPTFLYVIAFSVGVEVLIALAVIIKAPGSLGDLATLYEALAIPQGIAAAMCGVYLKKRSDDKAVAAGQNPPAGIGAALAGLVGKK